MVDDFAARGVEAPGLAVGPGRGDRVEGVGEGEDPGFERDLLALQAPRVTAAVVMLVVLQGDACRQLHQGLASCPESLAERLPKAHLLTDALCGAGAVQATIAPSEAAWLGAVIGALSAALGDQVAAMPRHLVHNDCHIGNIIFAACGAAGFIDFDFMRTNLRIFDPCYCLAGLLVDGLGHGLQAGRWIELRESLLAGYDSSSSLQVAERAMITYVIWAALLINAGWWVNAGRLDLAGANLCALQWLTSNRS